MKATGLSLFFIFLLQNLAWAGPQESLKQILDDYRYAVTVEWDQKDEQQLKNLKSQFAEQLKILALKEKLSASELENFLLTHSRDFKVSSHEISLLKNSQGELELSKVQSLLEERSKELYQQGSSWAPEEVLGYGLLGLLFFEIVVLIITARDDKCPNPQSFPNDVPYPCIYE